MLHRWQRHMQLLLWGDEWYSKMEGECCFRKKRVYDKIHRFVMHGQEDDNASCAGAD